MTHATPEQLNDYLDGSLPSDERAELQKHLDSCRRCLDEMRALRETVQALAELPRAGRPRRDLWPAVSARTVERARVTHISPARRRLRRLDLSLPQAVAAAAVIAMLAGGAVWITLGPGDPSREVARPTEHATLLVATPVGVEPYDQAVADLTRQLNRRAGELDPETLATIQANLEIIDAAIMEINEALARDPDSDYLNAYLSRAMRKKVDVLRQASLVRSRS